MSERSPDTHGVRTATEADLHIMTSTLGAAFHDDPVMVWLLGERRATVERIGYLDATLARAHLADGLSAMTSSGEAVAVWAAPKRFRVPVKEFIPNLPKVLRTLGPAGMWRLMRMTEVEKLHPREPHYYLAVLGTDPAHQGKGKGSAAMAPVLAKADEDGVGCYLESSKESNIAFYRRHGFEVTGTHQLGGGSGPTLWLMWRDPQITG